MSDATRWTAPGPPRQQQPQTNGGGGGANLADILERVLDKGIVIAGDIQVNLLDIELLTIKIRLVVASVDRAKEMGIDWWERDPTLSAGRRELEDENRDLRQRIEALEQGRYPELNGGQRGDAEDAENVHDDELADGEPDDGEPDDGEPDDGEPDDGEPDDGEPETDDRAEADRQRERRGPGRRARTSGADTDRSDGGGASRNDDRREPPARRRPAGGRSAGSSSGSRRR